jgi:D-3-phosphoglycerate dehydrogenase
LKLIGDVILIETEKKDLKNILANNNIFWFRLKFKIEKEDIPEKPECKFIICPATGLDHIDLEACKEKGIKVLGLKGETDFLQRVRATAELTIGLTIALIRKIPEAVNDVNSFNWRRDYFKGYEIFEKKVGIIGVGRLGKITARYFKAFGAEVYGYDILSFDESICEKKTIEEIFSSCDIISIHLAYNASTHHLIDQVLLNKMKPNGILINTSRGGVINSKDLLIALKEKKIAGAALDVLEDEYDIANSELIAYSSKNNNLIITPHIGGNTYESFEKTELFMVEKLKKELVLSDL